MSMESTFKNVSSYVLRRIGHQSDSWLKNDSPVFNCDSLSSCSKAQCNLIFAIKVAHNFDFEKTFTLIGIDSKTYESSEILTATFKLQPANWQDLENEIIQMLMEKRNKLLDIPKTVYCASLRNII